MKRRENKILVVDKKKTIGIFLREQWNNQSIKKKIMVFLLATTLLICGVIGVCSYYLSEKTVIKNSQTMAINLMKQVGLNLDERIQAFGDTSYRLIQSATVSNLINEGQQDVIFNQTKANSAFNTAILQQSSLTSYTKYALLMPTNGQVIEYYRAREKSKSEKEEREILDYLTSCVSVSRPITWVVWNDEVFFVRKIINNKLEDKGILCFAMTDKFFEFIGTTQDYLTNDNIVILTANKKILKNKMPEFSTDQIQQIAAHKDSTYYVYSCTLKGQKQTYSVVALNTISSNWTILSFMPYSALLKGVNKISVVLFATVLILAFLSVLLTSVITDTVTKNVELIRQGMQNYENGKFDWQIKPVCRDEIGLLALQFNDMGLKIENLICMLEKEEAAKRESEYRTLEAQINPHFLYNTLGSLRWASYRKKEYETADAIDSVVSLLQFTIKKAGQILPLAEELSYIENYIKIEKVRFGDCFSVSYEIENGVEQCKAPGFILQPFVENALIHGLDMTQANGQIRICAYRKENSLIITVQDNGVGMSVEKLVALKNQNVDEEIKNEAHAYHGFNSIGIKIVDTRLRGYYGNKYHMEIESVENQGTIVRLIFPYQEEV